MATTSTTSTGRRTRGRTAPRVVGVVVGILWAYAFGALVTLPPWGASPFDTSPDTSRLGSWLVDTGPERITGLSWPYVGAAVLALAMAALIRFRPAVLTGVAMGLAVFLVVGWAIGPWFGVGLSGALTPVGVIGYSSTVVRDPAVVGVCLLVIGLAVLRRRPER